MRGKQLLAPLGILAGAMAVLFGTSAICRSTAIHNQEKKQQEVFRKLLPGSETFAEEVYDGEDTSIISLFKGNNGYVVETKVNGYVDDMTLLVGVEDSGIVTGLTIQDMAETWGLGRRAMTDEVFLTQFLNYQSIRGKLPVTASVGGTGEAAVGENIDALAGATVSSKAVAKAVNSAVAYVTGADVVSSATEWGG